MSDNRKSFTPMDMLTSGGNGDVGCTTPFGYVTARYQGGEIVSVTVDEDRFVPGSGQGEPRGWLHCPRCGTHEVEVKQECHNSDCRGYAEDLTLYEGWKDTTPQLDDDGWVKCSERLPTKADSDALGFVWTFSEFLGITALDRQAFTEPPFYTHWKPTGLKRPQPPKEGEGDETRAAVMPSEHGKNRYGLDMAYFRELFNRELNRPLVDFRPDELARVLARAARAADAAVLQEPEFQAARAQGGQGAEPSGWLNKRGEILSADQKARLIESGGIVAASIRTNFTIPLYTQPQPSVPDKKPLPDLFMASYHEAIGWNACVDAMLACSPQPPQEGE